MEPIKTEEYDGIYGAPQGMEDSIGGLPYYRRKYFDSSIIYSVWEPTTAERKLIAKGVNILVGQVGEPVHPISVSITHLKRVENNRPPKPPKAPKDREMG